MRPVKIGWVIILLLATTCRAGQSEVPTVTPTEPATISARAEQALANWRTVCRPFIERAAEVRKKTELFLKKAEPTEEEEKEFLRETGRDLFEIRELYLKDAKTYLAAEKAVLEVMLDWLKQQLVGKSQGAIADLWLTEPQEGGDHSSAHRGAQGPLELLRQDQRWQEFLETYFTYENEVSALKLHALLRYGKPGEKDSIPITIRESTTTSHVTSGYDLTRRRPLVHKSSERQVKRPERQGAVVFVGAIVQLQSFTHSQTIAEPWLDRGSKRTSWVKQTVTIHKQGGIGASESVDDRSIYDKEQDRNPLFRGGRYMIWPLRY